MNELRRQKKEQAAAEAAKEAGQMETVKEEAEDDSNPSLQNPKTLENDN